MFCLIFLLAIILTMLAALAQMVACQPLIQQVRGSIPDGVVNFKLKIFNLGARKGWRFILSNRYSVFPFLRRVIYKLSSEVGCGEVTNPK